MENAALRSSPPALGLFQKRFAGDDALLALAALRFRQAGLAAEFYAETPADLERLWPYNPNPEAFSSVHLSRSLNMLNQASHDVIADFAGRFQGRLSCLVMHDQPEMASNHNAYIRAAESLALRLDKIPHCPRLFVEYAAGLDPSLFVNFFERIRRIECISACIDVGHVGIRQARHTYARSHSETDICALTPTHPDLPHLVADVEAAVRSALPATVELIERLGNLAKPLHFHLHDGHPLSTFSPYGVSDHLSFLYRIPIPFEHQGQSSLEPMYGPAGLFELVSTACRVLDSSKLSFNLEIHPPDGCLPLRDAEHLFAHWRDKTNAGRMNRWLWTLLENAQLLAAAIKQARVFRHS